MRKLATIRRINEIRPIPGADAIETAVVGGWTVVVKRGEFQPGDLAIYCEVDSWIPTEVAPFLSKGQEPREYNGVKGERLRSIKLRGTLSQGLLLPVTKTLADYARDFDDGEDVSDLLGIQKYEPPIPAQLAGQVEGVFPAIVPKTDEERIQNLSKELPDFLDVQWEVSEKLEGSSMTIARLDGAFKVCSRNLNLKETSDNSLWSVARRYNVEAKMVTTGLDNFVIQGEIIGEGIQGNHYGIKGQDFYVFRMFDVQSGEFVEPDRRLKLCKILGLKHVPVLESVINLRENSLTTIDQILDYADGKSVLNTAKLREGLVFKEVGGQRHWKAVSNKYLLKTGG